MNVSAKTAYAALALLELAVHYKSGEPVRIRAIAEAHGIPARFLVQILLQLKGAGLVSSTRGAAGGYQLVRAPAEITLGDVREIIEGQAALPEVDPGAATVSARVLREAWRAVARAERDAQSAITLADLVERVRGRTEAMYYI